MDFDKDIRRMYSRQNYVAKVFLVLLFVFCVVGFLLGIVFIYKNLNHRLLRVEEALLGKNVAAPVEGDSPSPGWNTNNNPVTTATTGTLSHEESLIHDLKKQGHSIKTKLEEIDKKILDLEPRITQDKKLTKQNLARPLKKTSKIQTEKTNVGAEKGQRLNKAKKKSIKVTKKPERKPK